MYKETVERNFSRYAHLYDDHSGVQLYTASRLISGLNKDSYKEILDIGCGTGNFTGLLRETFPGAIITALDISKRMVQIAKEKLYDKRIDFVIEDAERIELENRFDLVSSNASFQWFSDLEEAMNRFRRFLKDDGVINFSTFGPKTYQELNISLKELLNNDAGINASRFIDRDALGSLLKSLFKNIEITEELYVQQYDSLSDLLKKIKYTGTQGRGINGNGLWTPTLLKRLEEIYRDKFKDITATYQIFYCKGLR